MPTLYAALGTLIKMGNGASPEVFTTVAQVGNTTGPGMKADTIDVSNHNQVNAYKQFIAGLKEGGDLKFEIFFDPNEPSHYSTVLPSLLYNYENRLVSNWQVSLPVSPLAHWAFAGLVTAFDNKMDVNGALMASCSVKISGKPSMVLGS